jgi:hypothetical protein
MYGPGEETKQPQRQRKEWLPEHAGTFRALKTADCAQRIIIFFTLTPLSSDLITEILENVVL